MNGPVTSPSRSPRAPALAVPRPRGDRSGVPRPAWSRRVPARPPVARAAAPRLPPRPPDPPDSPEALRREAALDRCPEPAPRLAPVRERVRGWSSSGSSLGSTTSVRRPRPRAGTALPTPGRPRPVDVFPARPAPAPRPRPPSRVSPRTRSSRTGPRRPFVVPEPPRSPRPPPRRPSSPVPLRPRPPVGAPAPPSRALEPLPRLRPRVSPPRSCSPRPTRPDEAADRVPRRSEPRAEPAVEPPAPPPERRAPDPEAPERRAPDPDARAGRRSRPAPLLGCVTSCPRVVPHGRVGGARQRTARPAPSTPSGARAGRDDARRLRRRASSFEGFRQRPTLPGSLPPSTIGAGGLNGRVRNGNGCFPAAMATGNRSVLIPLENPIASTCIEKDSSPRPISTGRLNTLPCVHLRPIYLVVFQGPYPVNPVGHLISRRVSRLDAFSAYLFRRSPTSRAPGGTTGTRELRPSRSSRTRDSSPQMSCAYGG